MKLVSVTTNATELDLAVQNIIVTSIGPEFSKFHISSKIINNKMSRDHSHHLGDEV